MKEKSSKAEANYIDRAQACMDCTHFQLPHGCKLVAGTIRAGGWCKYFTARRSKPKTATHGDLKVMQT